MEIVEGSNVLVDAQVWARATHKSCTNASKMTRILLLGVFSTDTLLESSLKGGGDTRKPLDEAKVDAIYGKYWFSL